MKSTQIILLALVLATGALVAYLATSGKKSIEDSAIPTYAAKAWDLVSSGLAAAKSEHSEGSDSEIDPELDSAIEAALDRVFLERSGDYFSRSVWGAEPVPYQFRGLTVGEAVPVAVNPLDHTREIDRRMLVPLEVEAYRRYEKGTGWEPWQYEQPPHFEGLVFVRMRGRWRPEPAPDRFYSLR